MLIDQSGQGGGDIAGVVGDNEGAGNILNILSSMIDSWLKVMLIDKSLLLLLMLLFISCWRHARFSLSGSIPGVESSGSRQSLEQWFFMILAGRHCYTSLMIGLSQHCC